MAAYDAPSTNAVDAYAKTVLEAKNYATAYEQNVRQNLVPQDQAAGEAEETSYQDLKYATGVFDAASDRNATLEQQKEKLIQERDRRIAIAKEQALKEGKNEQEISQIVSEINLEYSDRIRNLDYNISLANKTTWQKHKTLADAQSVYQTTRFDKISTGNAVWSGFLRAGNLWSDVGKMQQFQGFLETQADMQTRHIDRMG
ncbi:MAG: hypothetical protein NC200_04470 [Candidatus Gastranaerophilales bacterium]|nr:hypothetical protein [Candidatus Gastranaerophilales bacterium]